MLILIIYFIAIIIFVKKIKEKANVRPVSNYSELLDEETPEQYVEQVYELGKYDEARELERKIMDFRDEEYHSEGMKPTVSRDELILKEQLKEFRHTEATGMAREDQSVYHKPFRLSELKEPLTKQEHDSIFHKPEPVVEIKETVADLQLFSDADEIQKSFIYHEVLSKPKSLR